MEVGGLYNVEDMKKLVACVVAEKLEVEVGEKTWPNCF